LVSEFDGAFGSPVLTVREVASALKVATSTVYKLCAEGKLAHTRVSNAIRISGGEVARFIGVRR
jgi:excisionase family DNA binding protein